MNYEKLSKCLEGSEQVSCEAIEKMFEEARLFTSKSIVEDIIHLLEAASKDNEEQLFLLLSVENNDSGCGDGFSYSVGVSLFQNENKEYLETFLSSLKEVNFHTYSKPIRLLSKAFDFFNFKDRIVSSTSNLINTKSQTKQTLINLFAHSGNVFSDHIYMFEEYFGSNEKCAECLLPYIENICNKFELFCNTFPNEGHESDRAIGLLFFKNPKDEKIHYCICDLNEFSNEW